MSGIPPNHETLRRRVRTHRNRKEFWEREGERSLGQNLAMIGALGWLIVVPALVGIFLGRWLDQLAATGIMWTAALLFLGVIAGCIMAWKRIHHD